jgi:hypothetical protein
MRSFPKPAILALGAAIGLIQAVGAEPPTKNSKKPGSKTEKVSKTDKTKDKAKDPNNDDLNLPIPKGEAQRSVKFPLYNAEGKLKMRFEIGVATKIDEENVKMQKLRIETFKEDETHELDMDLPDAVMNQRTKDITSNTAVFIKRDDFEITGNNMKFNTESRQGTLGGGVKMIIYDMQKTGGTGKADVKFEPNKKKEEPKK